MVTACPEAMSSSLSSSASTSGPSGAGRPSGRGSMRQNAFQNRVGQPGQGFVGDVVEGDVLLAHQPVIERDKQRPGLVVQDRHVQLVGRERQPGHGRVDAVVQERLAGFVPVQVHGLHVGIGVPVTQLAHGRGDDQAAGEPDRDPAGLGGGPGPRRGLDGGPQQCLGRRQEDLPGLGELAALRGPVQQARAELLLQALDLPAQRRLGEVQRGGGAAEVPVFGDDGEVAHQPQVEIGRGRFCHTRSVSRQLAVRTNDFDLELR